MTLPRDELVHIVLGALSLAERSNCVMMLDSRLHRRGEVIRLGARQLTLSADSFDVFVDLMPQANWGHSAAHVLIEANSGLCRREAVSFPPEDVDTPERFVEIFRSAPRP
jgi:hypothetical protein